ncbi:hypothetical protein GF357_00740 [Candidatus Dojkabacteria bacterium]|nr:hypothetical protein [Candidatus Dojkabacteria bacterium]
MVKKRTAKSRTRSKSTKTGKPDKILIYFTIGMALFGLLMIFDASVYQANTVFHNQFHFVLLQSIWLIIGLIPAIAIILWDYKKFCKLAFPALIVNIILLIAVLLIGIKLGGSKRWFLIGPIPIQPAELIKPIFIMYLATWLSKTEPKRSNSSEGLKKQFQQKLTQFLVILSVILLLVLFEPDLGTTMILGATAFGMFFLSGTNKIHRRGTIQVLIIFVIIAGVAALLKSYRIVRIKTFFQLLTTGEVADPWGEGYQMNQVLIGIGSGGFWGKGFGQSRQKFGYLVENTAFTDSIFAIILEELGMISGILILAAWGVFLWRTYVIYQNTNDKQGKLLAGGIGIWLTLQALMNIGANVGLIPLTGIPLPLLTYGGSGTLVAIIGIATLLNISKPANL